MEKNKSKINVTTISIICSLIGGGVIGGLIVSLKYGKYNNKYIEKIVDTYYLMKDQWFFSNDYGNEIDEYLTDLAVNGLTTNNKDRFTFYTNSLEEQGLGVVNKGIGIGHAYYGGDRIIKEVFEKSPAEKAGLKVGDVIIGIYDSTTNELIKFQDLSANELNDAFSYASDEEISLELQRGKVTIQKDIYTQYAISYSVSNSNNQVVVSVDIDNFLDRLLVKDFINDLNNVIEDYGHIDKLIIDLRDNGGGYVDLAMNLSSLFIPKNSVIVKVEDTKGHVSTYKNSIEPIYSSIKKINLIQNDSTASASELFILALKDNLPAEQVDVIGNYSYGKGIMQNVQENEDGSVIRYTSARTLSPNNYSIHGIGIKPTIEMTYDEELISYYGEVGFVTNDIKRHLLKQINLILNSNYNDYEEALQKFCEKESLAISEFNYQIGRLLQKKGYDLYLQYQNQVYQKALEV